MFWILDCRDWDRDNVQDNTEQHSMEDDTRDFELNDQFPSNEDQPAKK